MDDISPSLPRHTLVVATRNAHKLEEIRAIFRLPSLTLVGAAAFPHLPDVVEDGATFEDNASKKAVALARGTGLWSLADDSGLEVEALGGAPGVFSARYAGEPTDYTANNRKLLKELAGEKNRRARFRCVIALSSPTGRARCVHGACHGIIADAPRGQQGFGYDPLFVPGGYAVTFAELDSTRKNAISHRAIALQEALRRWSQVLEAVPPDWLD